MNEMFLVFVGPTGSQFETEKFKNFTDFRYETETYWVHLNIFIDRKRFPGESIRLLGGI